MQDCPSKLVRTLDYRRVTTDDAERPFSIRRGSHWTLLLSDDSRYVYEIDSHRGSGGPGDLLFCPPSSSLALRGADGSTFHYFLFDWNLPDDEQSVPVLCGKIAIRDSLRLETTVRLLRAVQVMHQSERLRFAHHYLQDVLMLCRLEKYLPASDPAHDPLIQKALAYMRELVSQPLSIRSVAERFLVSESQFARRFRSATGMTPLLYLTRLRLQTAQDLLAATDLTVEEIAYRCGYQNGCYVNRLFHKLLYTTPSEYRRAHRTLPRRTGEK